MCYYIFKFVIKRRKLKAIAAEKKRLEEEKKKKAQKGKKPGYMSRTTPKPVPKPVAKQTTVIVNKPN